MKKYSGTPQEFLNTIQDELEKVGASKVSASVGDSGTDVNQVLEYFSSHLGWDIQDEKVQKYAQAVAEYMQMCHEAYAKLNRECPYTLDDWYKDTAENYPEELEAFEGVEASTVLSARKHTGSPQELLALVKSMIPDAENEVEMSSEVEGAAVESAVDVTQRIADEIIAKLKETYGHEFSYHQYSSDKGDSVIFFDDTTSELFVADKGDIENTSTDLLVEDIAEGLNLTQDAEGAEDAVESSTKVNNSNYLHNLIAASDKLTDPVCHRCDTDWDDDGVYITYSSVNSSKTTSFTVPMTDISFKSIQADAKIIADAVLAEFEEPDDDEVDLDEMQDAGVSELDCPTL